jgi:hypothetical protein
MRRRGTPWPVLQPKRRTRARERPGFDQWFNTGWPAGCTVMEQGGRHSEQGRHLQDTI